MYNGSEQISKYLNTGKTKIVIFKSRNRKITKYLHFRKSGQKIPFDTVEFLGVTLQSDLHWKIHLKSLGKKKSKEEAWAYSRKQNTMYLNFFSNYLLFNL